MAFTFCLIIRCPCIGSCIDIARTIIGKAVVADIHFCIVIKPICSIKSEAASGVNRMIIEISDCHIDIGKFPADIRSRKCIYQLNQGFAQNLNSGLSG